MAQAGEGSCAMELYLIRHADAVQMAEGITSDAERPLSDAGKTQARALAGALQRRGIHLNMVLTSPLLRARQTAEEMLLHWSEPRPALQPSDELAMDGKLRRVVKEVRELGQESVALVGHQPDLAALAAWLIGSKKAQLDLAKAGVAAIHCDEEPRKGSGVLVWLVTPEWF
jgi:phosphohistidine phosphatase